MKPPHARTLPARLPAVSVAGLALVLTLCATACGSSDHEPSQPFTADTTDAAPPTHDTPVVEEKCDNGAMRECKVTLAKHGDVVSCAVGEQSCIDGVWSACHATTGP